MFDDPYDGYDWYYWDTVKKCGRLVADQAWAAKKRHERWSRLVRLLGKLLDAVERASSPREEEETGK